MAMSRRRNRCVCFLLLLSVSACADLAPKDENSPYYPVPAGSRLILHQDLTILPDSARVYLQYGKVVKAPRTSDPFCRFEVNDVLPSAQTLMADEFLVRKTQMDRLNISSRTPLTAAALHGFGRDEGDAVTLVWYLWLASPRQPNVRRLICGGSFDYPRRARRPSINEIRMQLGDIATLIAPAVN